MSKEPVVFSWSGGKDSAMALYELRQSNRYEVVALLTSVAEQYQRVSHHGVRIELLEQQADSIGIPLHKLYLPSAPTQPCTNEIYEELMTRTMLDYCSRGIRTVAFGDLFLQDLREYRERNLAKVDMHALFPIWHRETTELVRTCIRLGFKAWLSCVEDKLGRRFAGRALDEMLVEDLPEGIDPCGENGEYHSFVYDGRIFQWPVPTRVGEIVTIDGRHYADLLPANVPVGAAAELSIPPVR